MPNLPELRFTDEDSPSQELTASGMPRHLHQYIQVDNGFFLDCRQEDNFNMKLVLEMG